MAKQKFDTIEAAAEAMGVEVNEKTTPFLKTFVKKAEGEGVGASAKRNKLIEEAALYGIEIGDKDPTMALIVKIASALFAAELTEELTAFSEEHNIVVTEDGKIYGKRQGVKPIKERNSGMREGTVGYNTIQLLKDPELADKTTTELAAIIKERFEQDTTPNSVSWYVNYCKQKGIEICERKRHTTKKVEGGVALGAELSLEKAYAPKPQKAKATAAPEANIDPETLEVAEGVDTGAEEAGE